MLRIILSIVAKWGWTRWILLHLMVSGTLSLVTIHQPAVLTTALGHDVTMPCQLSLSYNEEIATSRFLYWVYSGEDTDNAKLWPPSEKYKERVDLLDKNEQSLNKSILFKSVQWADSGKYLCRLSVITIESDKRFRIAGDTTLLMVYDTMIFNLTNRNDSLLWCEVNVTRDPGFVLSIFHNGYKPQTIDSAPGDYFTAPSYVTLSETISLRGRGKYECQLHLNEELITESIFQYHLPVTGEGGDAEKNVTTVSDLGVVVFPEPWLLYAALLLVPITILLGLVMPLLMCRS